MLRKEYDPKLEMISTLPLLEALEALQDLRRKYQEVKHITRFNGDGTRNLFNCPLCNYDHFYPPKDERSCNCPWIWFYQKRCSHAAWRCDPIGDRFARIGVWERAVCRELVSRNIIPKTSVLF